MISIITPLLSQLIDSDFLNYPPRAWFYPTFSKKLTLGQLKLSHCTKVQILIQVICGQITGL